MHNDLQQPEPSDTGENAELVEKLRAARLPGAEDPEGLRRRVLAAAAQARTSTASPRPVSDSKTHPEPAGFIVWLTSGAGVAAAVALFAALLFVPQMNSRTQQELALEERAVAGDGEKDIQAQMEELVRQLADEDFQVREEAERKLEAFVREKGQKAFKILAEGTHDAILMGKETEIRTRVDQMINRLSTPRVVWWAETARCSFQAAAPALSGSQVVQATEEGLFSLSLASGDRSWWKAGDYEHSVAAIEGDRVFAMQPPHAYATFRLTDGAERWSSDLADLNLKAQNWKLDGSPCYDTKHDRVFVSGPQGRLVALRAQDGLRVWATDINEGKGGSPLPPSYDSKDDLILTGIWCGTLVAVHAGDGQIAWKAATKGIGYLPPTVARGRVYVAVTLDLEEPCQGYVRCFDTAQGKLLWTGDPNGVPPASATRSKEVETVTTTVVDNGASTVRSSVIVRPGDERSVVGAPLVLEESQRVVSQSKACIFALDLRNGKLLWRVPCLRFGYTSCTSRAGVVYAGSDQGEILAVRAEDGRLLWKLDLNKCRDAEHAPKVTVESKGARRVSLGTMGQPRILGDLLVATCESGWTFALRLPPFERNRVP